MEGGVRVPIVFELPGEIRRRSHDGVSGVLLYGVRQRIALRFVVVDLQTFAVRGGSAGEGKKGEGERGQHHQDRKEDAQRPVCLTHSHTSCKK